MSATYYVISTSEDTKGPNVDNHITPQNLSGKALAAVSSWMEKFSQKIIYNRNKTSEDMLMV